MNWKESKLIGATALVLMAASAVVLVMLARGGKPTGPKVPFICDSTGEVFTVYAVPGDKEYEENYLVDFTEAVPCKVSGCGKKDAYAANDFGGGNYVRYGLRPFICQSTGKTFNMPETRGTEGYERDYASAPYEKAFVCKICKQIDAYRAGVDSNGRWMVGIEPPPEESLEGESFVIPTDRALVIEEVRDLLDRKEAERKALEAEAPGGEQPAEGGDSAATEGGESTTPEPALEAPGD